MFQLSKIRIGGGRPGRLVLVLLSGVALVSLAVPADAQVVMPPVIAKAFGAAAIPLNTSTSLTFTITNPNAATDLTGVAA